MKKWYLGRFAVNVPLEMKQAAHVSKLRYCGVDDFVWAAGVTKEAARETVWQKRLADIRVLKPPRTKKDVVISLEDFSGLGEWSRGVYYFGNYMSDGVANLDLLVDFGRIGLWITCDSAKWNADNRVKIDKNASNIARAYNPHASFDHIHAGEGKFHLPYGALDLAYLRQEKTYARFEGHPLDLKLEVAMNEIHRVEKHGLLERLTAAVVTRFAPGVHVDRIRSRSRTVAGLKGDELVMRMSASGEDTQIHFCWEYRGEVDSGKRPEIQITMEAGDGRVEEKLKIWDEILQSFRPLYRQP